jgi:CTP synthase (UTP-ammonia lyase)
MFSYRELVKYFNMLVLVLHFVNTKKFWLGVQFHPEFNSSWEHPSETFMKFMGISKKEV